MITSNICLSIIPFTGDYFYKYHFLTNINLLKRHQYLLPLSKCTNILLLNSYRHKSKELINMLKNMKKRIVRSILISVFAAVFAASFIPAASVPAYAVSETDITATAYVNSSGGAYMRKDPTKKSRIVALIKDGTKLIVHYEMFTTNSTSPTSRWYSVSVGDKRGFIRADLIKGLKHDHAHMAWATEPLNFRYGPSVRMKARGTVSKNYSFYAVLPAYTWGVRQTWYKVRNGDGFFYACGDWMTFNQPAGASTIVDLSKPSGLFSSLFSSGGSGNATQSAASRAVAEGAVTWAVNIANDNSFHYGNGQHSHHNGCYFCGTQPSSKKKYVTGWEKTYCCNPFIHAAYAHGGNEPTMLKVCQGYGSYDWDDYKRSKLFANLGHPAQSSLIKGDVLCYDGHVAMYIGNGQLVEAATSDDGTRGSRSWNNSIAVNTLSASRYRGFTNVYRYIGKN